MNVTTASGPPRRLSILLVDDDALARRGARLLIEAVPEWSVCAEAADRPAALELAERLRPDLVVVDISMPGLAGVDLIGELRKILPEVEVLALTLHDGDRVVAQALKAGARGYVLKSESGEKLVEALAALSRHQTWFCSSVSEALLRSYLISAGADAADRLTRRERQIVKLITEGHSSRLIAQALRLSLKTVETHRGAAMRKVGARSAADLTL